MKVHDLLDALKDVDPNMDVVVATEFFYDVGWARPIFDTKLGNSEKKVFAIVPYNHKR